MGRPSKEKTNSIDDMPTFLRAIGEAKLGQMKFLEITPKLLESILQPKNLSGDYLIYDGIKVYAEGTREVLEAKDNESVLDR